MEKPCKSVSISYALWKYQVISSLQKGLEEASEDYTTFGIQVSLNGSCPALVIDVVEDISLERKTVEKIVAKFNRYQLSPLHFREILSDILE